MDREDLIAELAELHRTGAHAELGSLLDEMAVQDIAQAADEMDPEEAAALFDALPADRRPRVFAYLSLRLQLDLLERMDAEQSREVLAGLHPDDRTALFEQLGRDDLERLLRLLSPANVQEALRLLDYPERSAGRLMTPRVVSVRPGWTVQQALAHVRRQAERGETVNVVFVTDGRGRLLGHIRLRDFVLGEPDRRIEAIMSPDPVTVGVAEDREEAARLMQHYDLEVMPVVDATGVLLGVVTIDDVIDVVQEAATEDFHKIGSVGALNLSLKEARPSLLYRKRIGWLVVLVFVNVLSGGAIAYFEATIEQVVALVFFLPLIIGSGGNAGAQAATMMVRALATGDVKLNDWLRLWGKELGVAAALGVTMGLAVWGVGLWRGGPELATVVALAMVAVVIMGSMLGMLLPLLLARLDLDPATASAPLITSVADIGGILIYLSIATAILGLPAGG